MISHKHVSKIGHVVKRTAQIRGGGSALPGLVVEKIDPGFLSRVLSNLPHGVILISGTNGKTTTTKMVVELLRSSGMTVFTNKTGSNFTRGVIAGMLGSLNKNGMLEADIAVLELDEAHAIHFINQVKPRYSLLLNVMRDQLDRFGEIDYTASLLAKVAEATTAGVVLNREDPLIRKLSEVVPSSTEVRYFGLDTSLQKLFPSDHELYGTTEIVREAPPKIKPTDVILTGIQDKSATFAFGETQLRPVPLNIEGAHNMLNAAAALCIVRMVAGEKAEQEALLTALSNVKPAFGRSETIDVNGSPLEIMLVKNPASFRLAITAFAARDAANMIAINDNYADGRDMSWLWDVDFSTLKHVDMVSGIRAYDMAVRLQYDQVSVGRVEPSLQKAVKEFVQKDGPKRIYCTYTAMLRIRRILKTMYDIEGIE